MRRLGVALGLFLVACSSAEPTEAKDAGGGQIPPAETRGGTICIGSGGDCSAQADTNRCCNGSICASSHTDTSKAFCVSTCLRDDQCQSGCCKPLTDGTAAACVPATYCAPTCLPPGSACSSGQDCCAGAICTVVRATGETSCSATCTSHTQCKSGCCAPLTNSPYLVCSPVSFCQ